MDFDDPTERQKWLARLVASAKDHARDAHKPFELTTEFIKTLYAEQMGRCAATGLQIQPAALSRSACRRSLRARASIANRRAADICAAGVRSGELRNGTNGEEVFLTLTRAAAEREKQAGNDIQGCMDGQIHGASCRRRSLIREPARKRATQAAPTHTSLKRALTLGPEGLRKAAGRANQARSDVLA